MPLSKLTFKPGINKEGTTYSNEGGYYNCDKIRFRSGYAEKLGGWINQSYSYTYNGVARTLFNWVAYDGANLLAVGTDSKYYIENGGQYRDITPIRTGPVTLGATPISTTSGSKVVTVTATGHGTSAGSYVTFYNASATGTISGTVLTITGTVSGTFAVGQTVHGTNVTAGTTISSFGSGSGGAGTYNLNNSSTVATPTAITTSVAVGGLNIVGEYEVVSVPTANTMRIASPIVATSTATGGGTVLATYQLNAGGSIATLGVGWGATPWGSGGWGSPAGLAVTIPLRLWAQDIYEQDLIFCEIGGGIYYWEKNVVTFPRAVTLETYVNTQVKTIKSAATVPPEVSFSSGSATITVDSTDGISTGTVISGTGIPAGAYVPADWNYSTTVPLYVNGSPTVTTAVASGLYNFSYAGRHAPDETNFIIASDTSHFTIVLGSRPYNPEDFVPTFDPMLVRWSDQDNPYEWVAEATNQSGEQHLSNGSYLVTAINTRQEILVWSDAAVYNMQYVGPPYVWNFTLIGDNTSIISPNAVISVNTVVYWMGVDKFYMYNGRLETLQCSLWKFVYDNLNKNQKAQVVCGSNEGFSEIWWFYPSKYSQVNDSYVIFNYLEQTWYYGTMNRSAWLDSPLRAYPMAAFGIRTSYLTTNINATDTTITLVDGASYPASGTVVIDSERITYSSIDGSSLLGCVRGVEGTTAATHLAYTPVYYGVSNQVMFHEVGTDDESTTTPVPIASYLESSDFDIDDGQQFGFVWRVLPDITFRGSTAGSPQVVLSLKARLNSGSAYTTAFTDPTNVTRTSTVPVEQYTGQVYTRIRGRQMAFRVDSSEIGVAWQIGAMRIDIRPDGRR